MPSFRATQLTILRMETKPGVRRRGKRSCGACCAYPVIATIKIRMSSQRTLIKTPLAISEYVLQGKLNLPGRAAGLRNPAGLWIPSPIAQKRRRVGKKEIRMVGQIKELRAELNSRCFRNVDVLQDGEVESSVSRSGQGVITQVPEMSHAVIGITRSTDSGTGAGRGNKLGDVVIHVRTTEYRVVVPTGNKIRPQAILRKELSSLRCIAGV